MSKKYIFGILGITISKLLLKNMDILEQLGELGLDGKAAKAYLAILKLQKANANQIAKEAGIERTTVYNILEKLKEKQLVTQSREGKRIAYWAESPAILQQILLKQSEVLKGLLPLLSSLEGKVEAKPTIKYYDNRESILKVYWESLKCQEKVFRNLAAVSNIERFLGDKFINKYTAERVKRKIFTKSFRSHPGVGREEPTKNWYLKDENTEVLRENRYLPETIKLDGFIKVYDQTIMLITFKREPTLIVIESLELAETIKALFDLAWSAVVR